MMDQSGMTSLDELIEAEEAYFAPMLERGLKSSPDDQARWRTETVRQRQERISFEIYNLCEGTVRYGPFRGLKLDLNTWWGKLDLGNQCLGLYEKEFLDYFEQLDQHTFSNFIDIGAADGYYAVGSLVSGIVDSVVCFEQSKEGQETIRRNWIRNGSKGRLRILGEANTDVISMLPNSELERALVMIDIEGAEFSLLNEDVFESFRRATVIIEIHNWVENFIDLYAELLRRADKHHEISVMKRVERPTVDIPELRDFTDDNRLLLTSERRPCLMRFLLLKPKP